jgi:hypothetical protein
MPGVIIGEGITINSGISIVPEYEFPFPAGAPVVSGTIQAGRLLSTTNGTWNVLFPIDGYNYQWYNNNIPISGATANTFVLTSTQIGTNIKCLVTAYNIYGSGSNFSNTVGPITTGVPQAPINVFATKTSSTSASVAFDIPTDNGGSGIVGYTVTASPGGATIVGSTSPINFTALVSGRDYTFTVQANNANGSSLPSLPSNSVSIFPDIGEYIYGGYYAGLSNLTTPTVNALLIVADNSSGAFFGTYNSVGTSVGALVLAGYSDWTIPNIGDLAQQCLYKSIFTSIGQGYPSSGAAGSHWSRTEESFGSGANKTIFFGACQQSFVQRTSSISGRAVRYENVSKV